MIKRVGGAMALTTAILSVGGAALAAPPLPRPENSLLGIRLMGTFNDVLRKYGQPSEIQIGSPTLPSQVPQQPNQGMTPGGIPGLPGRPGMTPGDIMDEMEGGTPRRGMMGAPGGLPGFPGMPGAGAYPGMAGGAMNRRMTGGGPPMMRGGMPGYPGMPGAAMGRPGMPGMPGALPGFPGAGGAGMLPGYPGANLNNTPQYGPEEQTQETTWWYHYPQKGLHYAFLFNNDGRVIQIQEYGWKGGGKTTEGVGLGSGLGQVIRQYGWSNDGDRTGDNLTLIYGGRDRLAIQLLRHRVAGITLGLVRK